MSRKYNGIWRRRTNIDFFCHLENIQTANIHDRVDTFWYLKQKSSKLFVCRIKAKQSNPNAANDNETISIPQISVHFHIGYFCLFVISFVFYRLLYTPRIDFDVYVRLSICYANNISTKSEQ